MSRRSWFSLESYKKGAHGLARNRTRGSFYALGKRNGAECQQTLVTGERTERTSESVRVPTRFARHALSRRLAACAKLRGRLHIPLPEKHRKDRVRVGFYAHKHPRRWASAVATLQEHVRHCM